jgi:hypothetical protein
VIASSVHNAICAEQAEGDSTWHAVRTPAKALHVDAVVTTAYWSTEESIVQEC